MAQCDSAASSGGGRGGQQQQQRQQSPADTYVLIDLEHAGKPIQGWDVRDMIIVIAAG